MLKYLIPVIFLNSIACLELADKVISSTFPVGDPDNLLQGAVKPLKEYCAGENLEAFANVGRKYFEIRYGEGQVSKEAIYRITGAIENIQKSSFCLKLKELGEEKFTKMVVDMDKLVDQAKKPRAQLHTALTEAANKDTKTTLPLLVCFCRQWIQKTIDVYPEKEQKNLVKDALDDILKNVLEYLETIKGKAPDSCELPAASTEPSKYKSIHIPFILAVNNLIKK